MRRGDLSAAWPKQIAGAPWKGYTQDGRSLEVVAHFERVLVHSEYMDGVRPWRVTRDRSSLGPGSAGEQAQ
jgi:hypothetical protein